MSIPCFDRHPLTLIALGTYFVIVTAMLIGCASLLFGPSSITPDTARDLLNELDAALTLYEEAFIPDDATDLQLLAFEAIQTARRLLIVTLLDKLAEQSDAIALDAFRDRLAHTDIIEPEPDAP